MGNDQCFDRRSNGLTLSSAWPNTVTVWHFKVVCILMCAGEFQCTNCPGERNSCKDCQGWHIIFFFLLFSEPKWQWSRRVRLGLIKWNWSIVVSRVFVFAKIFSNKRALFMPNFLFEYVCFYSSMIQTFPFPDVIKNGEKFAKSNNVKSEREKSINTYANAHFSMNFFSFRSCSVQPIFLSNINIYQFVSSPDVNAIIVSFI